MIQFLNVAMVVNTYGISVGMEAIGWKLYIVYIGWICVEIVLVCHVIASLTEILSLTSF